MLTVDNLHTYYGESHILHDISLHVKKGSVSVLLGRNGMGKTTTLHTIMGLVAPKEGKVLFEGNELQSKPSYQISRAGIGLVPQGRRIFSNLTVKENLLTTYKPVENGWDIESIFSMFPRLKERQKSMGGNLSGGEQQMLSIGRALMTNPRLLLLDEPSEGLSPLIVSDVIKIIKELKKNGMSMLIVEQNLSMASELADYVYILSKGAVAFEGETEAFSRDVKQKYLSVT
ncbi:ABC transporter ATP-binding protein [Lentibacillus salinarum]|uniref:ABC transporter ATP-binding protein n=1 Tax=Lentibacillus salinarum TaxID=446820 RepID=A0ABW3ZSN2_9BACI